jgi:hypothetical protein
MQINYTQRGFIPIVIVVAFMLLAIGFVAFQEKSSRKVSVTPLTPPSTNVPNNSPNPFSKKSADLRVIGEYPQEIRKVKDEELVGIKCSISQFDLYRELPEESIYESTLNDEKSVVSRSIREAIVQLIDRDTMYAERFQFCVTEDDRILASHQFDNKQLHGLRSVYFEQVSSDRTIIPLGRFQYDTHKYYQDNFVHQDFFNCSKPIMLTKSGIFYEECYADLAVNPGREPNPETRKSELKSILLKVDLNTKNVFLVDTCTSDLSDTTCK